jgi:hypothetical protein
MRANYHQTCVTRVCMCFKYQRTCAIRLYICSSTCPQIVLVYSRNTCVYIHTCRMSKTREIHVFLWFSQKCCWEMGRQLLLHKNHGIESYTDTYIYIYIYIYTYKYAYMDSTSLSYRGKRNGNLRFGVKKPSTSLIWYASNGCDPCILHQSYVTVTITVTDCLF